MPGDARDSETDDEDEELWGNQGDSEQPPQFGRVERVVEHAWFFCGGWQPERLPIYLALYPLAEGMDIDMLCHLLQHLAREVNKKD